MAISRRPSSQIGSDTLSVRDETFRALGKKLSSNRRWVPNSVNWGRYWPRWPLRNAEAARSLARAARYCGPWSTAIWTASSTPDRQLGRLGGVHGLGIHRPGLADPAPELQPRHPERRVPPQLVGPRLGELEHELQRVALHRGAGDHPRPRDAEPLLRPPGAVGRDPATAPGSAAPRSSRTRSAARSGTAAAARCASALSSSARVRPRSANFRAAEQVVAGLNGGVDRLGLVRSGADVEELGRVLGGVDRRRERRQHEHRQRGPPPPLGIVHLAERADVVGIEPGGAGDRLRRA